jgi:GT2 family glycosyltransferase/2-polyprenyl-3-methyl-5-hydroxy-6-metoxy-1,4-benzoquinol methylase
MSSQSISVIVVNWNRRELLRACLRSLMKQTKAQFQLIVVDNGSTDGSAEMVSSEFPNSELIRNSENLGFCHANNQGIRVARGECIALLNNDAEADPEFLSELVNVIDRDVEVGMAAAKIVVFSDPSRIDKVGHLIWLDGQNRGRGTGALDVGQFDLQEEVLWPDGCAAMYRRSMLEQIGGFDEDFFAYGDDAELGLRARIAGWKCVYNPRAVVRHHHSSTLGAGSVKRLALIERNRVLLAAKLFPWSLLWLNVFYYLQRLVVGAAAAAAGQGEATSFPGITGKLRLMFGLFWGDLQALPLLPGMLRKRATIVRKLSARQTRELILSHRISLKELSTKAAWVSARASEPCLRCGSEEVAYLTEGTDRLYRTTAARFQIAQCKNCGLIRLSPRPKPAQLAHFYPGNYWFDPAEDTASRWAEQYRRLVLQDHVNFVFQSYRKASQSGPILDVGCGGGLLPGMLRERGFLAMGLDSSQQACQIAWQGHHVPAVRGDLNNAPFPPESFSLITLFHVLEHLTNPGDYLDAAAKLLRPGGHLIVQVPNIDSWQFRLLGARWNGLDIPRHLTDFRTEDVVFFLEKHGFEILRIKHFSLRDNPAGLATSLAPSLDPMARRINGQPSSMPHNLAYLALTLAAVPFALMEAAFGHGSSVMVEARKR